MKQIKFFYINYIKLVGIILLIMFTCQANAEEKIEKLEVGYDNGLLSVKTENVTLKRLFNEITAKTKIEAEILDKELEDTKLTIEFKKLNIEDSIKKILTATEIKNLLSICRLSKDKTTIIDIKAGKNDTMMTWFEKEKLKNENKNGTKYETASKEESLVKSSITIKYQSGMLDADISSATINEIFEEFKKVAGIDYEIEKEILEQKVSISFKGKELVQGIKDILNTIGNPSYMLNYKKNKDGKYEVSSINIKKSGSRDLSSGAMKRELQDGEIEIVLEEVVGDEGKLEVKYKLRAKNVDINELLDRLSSVGTIHDKIIADRIDRKVSIDAENWTVATMLDDIFLKIRPNIYKVDRIFPEWDKKKNLVKTGSFKITRLPDTEIRHRREQAELKNAEGERLMQKGRYQEALQALEESSGAWDKDYVLPLKNLAKIYLITGRPETGVQFLNEALEITKEDPEVYQLLGDVYKTNNQIDLALQNYNKFMEMEKNEKKKAKTKEILADLGLSKTKNFYAQMSKGDEYVKQNKFSDAEKSYKEAMDIEPSAKSSYIKLGELYSSKDEYKKALDIYKRMQEKYPDDCESYGRLGMAYGGMGKFDEAIKMLEKAKEFASEGVKINLDYLISLYKKAKKEVEEKKKK